MRGCLAGSYSAAAVFGFLTVTFVVEGIISKNHLWTGGGFLFFVLTTWQLIALSAASPGNSSRIQLEITPELLSETAGPADPGAPGRRRQWLRSAVADVRIEQESDGPPELRIHFNDGQDAFCLLSGLDPDELRWVAEQIRLKWKLAGGSVNGTS